MPMQTYCPNCFEKIEQGTITCPSCGTSIQGWGKLMSETERLIHALGHPERTVRIKALGDLAGLPQSEAALPVSDLCFSMPEDIWQSVEAIRTLTAMPAVEKVEVALARLALEHPAGPVQTLAEHVLVARFGQTAA